jgi:hypothetical protein
MRFIICISTRFHGITGLISSRSRYLLSTYRNSLRESLTPLATTNLPPIVLPPALVVYISLSKSFAERRLDLMWPGWRSLPSLLILTDLLARPYRLALPD